MGKMPAVFERAGLQYKGMLEKVEADPKLPRTIKPDGSVLTVKPEDWTSGFFPGNLWFLYEYDRSAFWKEKALAYTRRLEVIRHFKGNHDGGFMLGCSYGSALRLSPDDEHRAVLRDAAAALATRFRPSIGMIQSWDHKPYTCPVIIDNMMNLEMLSWASKESNNPEFKKIAVNHADTTLKNHFRPDNSCFHVVNYNPQDGSVTWKRTHQGASDNSAWARGQAWGLYGYTMMYRETQNPAYLEQANKIANFLIHHPRMPEDKIPYWDFDAPNIPNEERDAAAGAVMASALVELSTLVSKDKGQEYLAFARQQLLSLSSPAYTARVGENGHFILMHSVGSKPHHSEIDVPLNYTDYYYLEALLRYRNAMNSASAH